MQSDNRVLNDLSRLATGALGAIQGVKTDVEQAFRQKLEQALAGMDLVQREEFDAVKEMARLAREENIALKARLDALEARLAPPPSLQGANMDSA
ncbi:accessory factor UbiK family protein [Ferrovibrio sp.]|uniref:accessory factor UbiK family protein n=1 Tax=Ferrovibrio sp. TaxID=1917215 RepID=UPI001B6AC787|nr:accessory factor UbiK family protein [Ferrovibrio sp.]MBP7064677.1 accessory factor UbiK family protein [Ferrovibrio sp.]